MSWTPIRSRWLARVLPTVLLALLACPALAGPCTGKANGLWCDGSNLLNCQGGTVTSTKPCPSGCQSNPPGVADACKSASGPCAGKANGLWCNGNDLLTCQGGTVTSTKSCPSGCQSNPPGVADACKNASGPCAGKANGLWCNGNDLLDCQGGTVSSSQTCPNGCQSNPAGTADACKTSVPQGFCSGKADGAWCDGSDLKQCQGGSVSSSQGCPNGCQSNPAGTADACKASTPKGFCSGKADGAWCDGSSLKQCKGGSVTSSQDCPDGCQSNPSGVADACKTVVPKGFCSGKADGAWCDGSDLKQCQGGSVTSSSSCKAGCQQNPPGTPDACKAEGPPPSGFCAGKANGAWCNGNSLVQCAGQAVDSSQGCQFGCQKNAPGTDDSCKTGGGPVPFCKQMGDGDWCLYDVLATCKGGVSVKDTVCVHGCTTSPPGVPDYCSPIADTGSCASQPDGQWCQGSALLQCKGGVQLAAMSCANGCQSLGGKGSATCAYKSKGFCATKADGAWCDGPLLTTCQGGKLAGVLACAKGCQAMPDGVPDQCTAALPATSSGPLSVSDASGCAQFSGSVDLWKGKGYESYDQKAYGDGLGSCPGLTIHSSGCTITALSMLHRMLGLTRTVGGKSGTTPDLENAWRIANDGYGATTYDGKSGNCLVIWSKTAGNLVASKHHNDSASCLSPSAAKAIASSLNSGMPALASVHWAGGNPAWYGGSEDWHWILVVGADSGGLLINDPWGGASRIRLQDGALGSYVVDTVYTFFTAPGSANFSQAAIDETGEVLGQDQLPNSLERIPTEGSFVDAGTSTSPDSSGADLQPAGSSAPIHGGCSSRPVAAPFPGWFAGFGLFAWWRRRRQRA